MTPFQWHTVLTRHVDQKLHQGPGSLVLAAPYDAQFSTTELKDWEQEDYVRHSLRVLQEVAVRHRVPVVLSVDMPRWWRTHPTLAQVTQEAAQARWTIVRRGDGWGAYAEGRALYHRTGRQASLEAYALGEPLVVAARRPATFIHPVGRKLA